MTKYLKCLGATAALLAALLGCTLLRSWLLEVGEDGPRAAVKVENPVPPDLDQLAALGLKPFNTHLPVLMMDTRDQQLLKGEPRWVEIAVLDDPTGKNNVLNKADMVLAATAKYRGASSYSGFDKAQYRVKFYHQLGGKSKKYPLCGMARDSEWVLHGPFLDRTLIRNALMYQLSREVMDYAPDCRFLELFVDGAYQGVYLAVEPITAGENRLDLSPFSLMNGQTPYIIKRDRVGTEHNVLHTWGEEIGQTGNELSVSYPGKNSLTEKQRSWIEDDISAFEQALYGEDFDDPELGYAAYIDVDSFAEYFLLNEFALNHDGGMLSTYAYKDLDGKLRMCVWDFNNGFDNYRWFPMDTEQFHQTEANWFNRLLQDRAFVDRVVTRYRELRNGSLSDAHITVLIDRNLKTLGKAINRNFHLWGYTFETSLLSSGEDGAKRDPRDFPEALDQLESTIHRRLKFMDRAISTLYFDCIN